MKTFTYILLALLLIGMFLTGYFVAKNKFKLHAAVLPQNMPSVTNVNPVNVYKDSNGVTHNVYSAAANTYTKKEALKQSSLLIPLIDSVAKALNVKSKQVETATTITTNTTADSIPFYKKQVDSLRNLVLYYSDKYLKLVVRVNSDVTDTLDKGSFDFSYDADLKIYQYWKRKQVWGLNIGSKQHFTDISSNDPRTTIGGLKTLTIKQNLPQIGLRIQAVTNYSFSTHSFSPGLGFRFDADRFSLNGIYYYSTDVSEWRPVLSLRYDIIQF
jgi:hypothetical protein